VVPAGVGTLLISVMTGVGLVAVAVKVTVPVAGAATALTACESGVGPRVKTVLARPLASVIDVAGETLPPPLTTDQVTWTPTAAAPCVSATATLSGVASTAFGKAACPLPLNTATTYGPAGLPGVVVLLELHAAPASTTATSATSDALMNGLLTT